jgi:hypothetical protein
MHGATGSASRCGLLRMRSTGIDGRRMPSSLGRCAHARLVQPSMHVNAPPLAALHAVTGVSAVGGAGGIAGRERDAAGLDRRPGRCHRLQVAVAAADGGVALTTGTLALRQLRPRAGT